MDAIRKRVQRDTIPHKKDPDGRVWILLDTDRTQQDTVQDTTGQRQDALLEAKDETIADLRDRVEFLERELERRGDETARLHQIVGGLTQANTRLAARVPELEAPASPEARESPVSPGPTQHPTPAAGDAHEPTEAPQRRSWWRRLMGG